jgi:signal transduction histidine kinase
VLHVLQDPVFVFDAFGSIRLANGAAESLVGARASLLRTDIREALFDGELADAIRTGLAEGSVAGRSFECDYDVPMGVNAGARTYEVRTLAMGEESEGPFVLVLHDLTRERDISRMKSDFVSKASHELRTPLASIRAHLEMLVDGEACGEAEQAGFFSMMLEDTDRLAGLVENMLNISRIEAGIVRPQLEQSDLGKIAESVAHRLEPAAAGKTISIAVAAAPVDLSVEGDASMLQEVVENLVSNAIKYTPEGGRVTISVDTDPLERSVLVSVADTGLGIPPESHERVFEKFFRIPSYERMARGTGLGLNLCRNIVESVHQGRIGVDSTVGEGSRFWFSVPMGFAGARAA